jgi:enoyl-CoA hydratase
MAVSLALVRRSRGLSVADALRLERVVMWHGFAAAARGGHCEALEGIRALSLDKDRQPRWQPASVAAVTPEAVDAFFTSPWTVETHPLAGLA